MSNAKEEVAKLLIKIRAVELNPTEGFVYASGRKGPIYCDNRLILSYPNEREAIVNAFVALLREKNIECDIVAGVATGAIAWAALVAEKLKKPMIYIRSEAKSHGKENQIEGKVEQGKKVVVFEDLVNSGGSSVEACKAVTEAGAVLSACVAVFTYGFADAHKKFSDAGINLFALSDFDALLLSALHIKYITEADKKTLLEWHSNPKEWAPKSG